MAAGYVEPNPTRSVARTATRSEVKYTLVSVTTEAFWRITTMLCGLGMRAPQQHSAMHRRVDGQWCRPGCPPESGRQVQGADALK